MSINRAKFSLGCQLIFIAYRFNQYFQTKVERSGDLAY